MSIEHAAGTRVALAEALGEYTDSGSGEPVLRVFDSGSVLLVSIDLDAGSAFTVSTAQANASLNGTPSGIAAASGVPASFDILNGDGDTVYTGSAGIQDSTADLALDYADEIVEGQTVTVLTHSWQLF